MHFLQEWFVLRTQPSSLIYSILNGHPSELLYIFRPLIISKKKYRADPTIPESSGSGYYTKSLIPFDLNWSCLHAIKIKCICLRNLLMDNYSISGVNTQNCLLRPNRNLSLQRWANTKRSVALSRFLYSDKKSNMQYSNLFVKFPGVIIM